MQNRYVLFLLVLAVCTFIGGTVYVASVGLHEKILFPSYTDVKGMIVKLLYFVNRDTFDCFIEVPQHWIIRAINYNHISDYLLNNTKKTDKQHKSMPFNYDYKLVCYYNLPAATHKNVNFLLVEDIDPNLCTHINTAFADIVNNSIHLEEHQVESIKSLVGLKKINKNLKVLVSIGGAGNDMGFPMMVANHENRKT